MRKKILLWGTGDRTKHFLEKNYFSECEIIGIIDTYKKEENFMGYRVFDLNCISNLEKKVDFFVISNQYYQEIVEIMHKMNVNESKIVITDPIKYEPYYCYYLRLKDVCVQIFDLSKFQYRRIVRENERDAVDYTSFYSNHDVKPDEYNNDYFRYRTFEFVADEINRRKVEGEVAELGVFKGLFSALINRKFSDRKLFLFDTFEGFNTSEAMKEIELGRCNSDFVESHKDTSVELMLSNLPYPDKAVVIKGLFPSSVDEATKQEKFAFVSLDVDFEESTVEGLRFFYPRLSEGGYIFIHDYNTYYLDGIKEAVDKYEKELGYPLHYVPLADRAGTIVIVK